MLRICLIGLILFPTILILNGCWDFAKLRDRTVILGIGIDKHQAGNKMSVEIVQFAAGPEASQVGKNKVLTTTSPHESIEMQLHGYQTRTSGSPYYANLQLLVIGKEQAKAGISGIISHFIRDPNMRRSTSVVISDGSAIELLENKSQQERFISFYLDKLAKNTEVTGKTMSSDVGSISRAIHENTVSLIPLIKPYKSKSEVKVIGTAVVDKNGKMVDQLNTEESKVVAYLKKPIVKVGSILIKCPKTGERAASMDLIKTKASLEPKVIGNKILVKGKLKLTGDLAEYTCGKNKVDGQTSLAELEKGFSQEVSEQVNTKLTSILHRTGADVIDVHEKLQRNPKEWKKIEKKIKELLKNAEVDIDVVVELINKGSEA